MHLEQFNNFKPKDFLKLGQKLKEMQNQFVESNSAVTRTIMSRIYYSTFLYVREWAKQYLGYESKPYKDHKQLPNFIARKGPFCESLNQDIAGSLRTLKKLRQQSDYDLKIPKKGTNAYNHWNFTNVNDAIDLANKIFDSFESLK